MLQTYHIQNRGSIRCFPDITVRQMLARICFELPGPSFRDPELLTIYDCRRGHVVTDLSRTLEQEHLSEDDLFLCGHIPGKLLLVEGSQNLAFDFLFCDAYKGISDPVELPFHHDGGFLYPVAAGAWTLGAYLEVLAAHGLISADAESMIVHDCYCWDSSSRDPVDIRPGAPVLEKTLAQFDSELRWGPPFYLSFE